MGYLIDEMVRTSFDAAELRLAASAATKSVGGVKELMEEATCRAQDAQNSQVGADGRWLGNIGKRFFPIGCGHNGRRVARKTKSV